MGPFAKTLVLVAVLVDCGMLVRSAPHPAPVYYVPFFEDESLVYPQLQEMDEGEALLQIVDGYELNLHQSTIFPPRVLVRTFENGQPVDEMIPTDEFSEDIFCDRGSGASVIIRRDPITNKTTVEGILDNELRIVPVNDSKGGDNAHKVFRVKDKNSHPLDSIFTNNASLIDDVDRNEITKRGIHNSTLFVRPEVVIVSDSAHNSRFKNKGDLLRYIGVFMNAVNLRYSTASGLDIKMKLTALIISSPDQETYFKYAGNYVNADKTLADFTLRLATGYIPGNFDFAYLLTGRDIAQVMPSGSLHSAVAGVAYIGGACTVQRTGLGEDVPGTYDGVHVATHEMAHLMGCVHDGDPPPDYLSDSPGAKDCPWDDGFIMSYKDGGLNHYMFSSCCVAQIKHLLRRGSHDCLLEQYNYPLKMDKRLPGELLSPLDYCRIRFPEIPFVWTDANPDDLIQCKIRCSYPVNPYTRQYVFRQANALDGTPCAIGKRCINGACE